jgi:hypothetical protein
MGVAVIASARMGASERQELSSTRPGMKRNAVLRIAIRIKQWETVKAPF